LTNFPSGKWLVFGAIPGDCRQGGVIVKLFRAAGLFFFVLAAVFLGGADAQAAELWATDPANGTKICVVSKADGVTLVSANWSGPAAGGLAEGQGTLVYVYKDKSGKEIKAQGDVEMKAGKLNGKVSINWSDGASYDGYYRDGWRNGQGIYRWPDGKVYEGEWKNGVREGNGVVKDAAGKVIHEGLWKDDKPAGESAAVGPAGALKADKVLGIPWGAGEDETRRIMKERPGTGYLGIYKGDRYLRQVYKGTFNNDPATIMFNFYQGKMFSVMVHQFLDEEQLLNKFNELKAGMTQRYGPPIKESGKYLDAKVWWDLGPNYRASLIIMKNPDKPDPPFVVTLGYWQIDISSSLFWSKSGSGGKDY
jgi:hypothetical protein